MSAPDIKSMTRERRQLEWLLFQPLDAREGVTCERCGGTIYKGDWPWCHGREEDHRR